MAGKDFFKRRLLQVESELLSSAVMLKHLGQDDILRHTSERYELLKERAYIMSILLFNGEWA